MLIKTLLNRMEKFKAFVFCKAWIEESQGKETLVVDIQPRKNSRMECSICGRRRDVYDTREIREYEYLPFWVYQVIFRYAPRRVNCPWDGIQPEWIPWANGKERMTTRYKMILDRWARRLSLKATAQLFETSWGCVFRAVQFVVDYGLAHRSLGGGHPNRRGRDRRIQGGQVPHHGLSAERRLSTPSLVRTRAKGRDSAPILSDIRERTRVQTSIRLHRHVATLSGCDQATRPAGTEHS